MSEPSEPLLDQFFVYQCLREHFQPVAKLFADFAQEIIESVPRNPERTASLHKLLEAQTYAIRAVLYKDNGKD